MKNFSQKIVAASIMLAAGNAWFGIGYAAEGKGGFQPGDWVAVSNEKLDQLRGGFDVGRGLTVSFGFIRTVMINGDLVTKSSFNIPDIAKITPDQAKTTAIAMAQAGVVVQNGPGNSVESLAGKGITPPTPTPTLSPLPIALPTSTIVQNSLNNQNIQTLTVINTGVNSLSLLKTINTQIVLKEALLDALGVH